MDGTNGRDLDSNLKSTPTPHLRSINKDQKDKRKRSFNEFYSSVK